MVKPKLIDKRAIFKAMQWLNYCSTKKTTLNASAQDQCKPESSAVVNLLMIYRTYIAGATTRK